MQSEKIIIVNENDEEIGFKNRDRIKRNDIYRVSALWIENSQEKVLMAQRSFKKKNSPGKWGPAVAGTIKKGEDHDSNIYQEAEDEIGLKDQIFDKAHKTKTIGSHKFFCQWYYLKIDKDIDYFKIQEEEVEAIKWIKKTDLEKELKSNPDKFLVSMAATLRKFKKFEK